jgi:hypothetical protein
LLQIRKFKLVRTTTHSFFAIIAALETSAGFPFCAAKKPFNAKTKLPTRNIRTSNPHELQSDFQLVFRGGSFNQNELVRCDSQHKGRDNVKVPLQKLQALDAHESKYYGDWRLL